MAGLFLKASAVSVETMKLTKKQIEVRMQMVSAANLHQLERKPVPQLPAMPLAKM